MLCRGNSSRGPAFQLLIMAALTVASGMFPDGALAQTGAVPDTVRSTVRRHLAEQNIPGLSVAVVVDDQGFCVALISNHRARPDAMVDDIISIFYDAGAMGNLP